MAGPIDRQWPRAERFAKFWNLRSLASLRRLRARSVRRSVPRYCDAQPTGCSSIALQTVWPRCWFLDLVPSRRLALARLR